MESGQSLLKKTIESLHKEGIGRTTQKVKNFILNKKKNIITASYYEPCMDVLFINGCDSAIAPHPPRYRITHQKEQLIANNICSNEVYYTALSLEQVRNYRVFIFFRCPITPLIEEFICIAKQLHKAVLFDIDDLVIDTKYTDQIPYVQSLSQDEKKIYDEGVIRMGKTLSLCDAAITSTERLAEELSRYVPEVFINRNTASELMIKYSEDVLKKSKHPENENIMLSKNRKYIKKESEHKKERNARVRIGYFSGSITHNADFELILPAIAKILRKNSDVSLHIVGELELPKELKSYQSQIIKEEFIDWTKLPALIESVDINLAPLEETIFNEAKSENKWVEAALVKVPTIASNVGAFKKMIRPCLKNQGR